MSVLGLTFPQFCIGCDGLCPTGLCAACIGSLPRLSSPGCSRCGSPTSVSIQCCRECRGRDLAFDRATQAVAFTATARRTIHAFKYSSRWKLAPSLASILDGRIDPSRFDAITWIPASSQRQRSRGFDPGRCLAEALAPTLELPVCEFLTRTRDTLPQMKLSPVERRTNLNGAFRARMPSAHRVAVIDDVYTTGATASEAARALKARGAKVVEVFCVARTLSPAQISAL